MITRERLNRYVEKGLLTRKDKDNLSLFCYTPEAQFSKSWDDVTVIARGLIIDDQDKIRALPFPKFFNLNEMPQTTVANLPKDMPEVSEKLDGSLGITFRDGMGNIRFATKGSFDSEQAQEAQKIWDAKYSHLDKEIPVHLTLLFEIIHPVSKVVVGYDYEDLVLLGVNDMYSGKELSYSETAEFAKKYGFRTCGMYSKTIDQIIAEQDKEFDNTEGYVLRFANGLRVKVKNRMYLKYHRMVSSFTDKNVWDLMRHGEFEKFLAECPEEYREEVEGLAKNIKEAHEQMLDRCNKAFKSIPDYSDDKGFALYVLEKHSDISGIMFSMRKGKVDSVNKIIFNMIKEDLGI